MTTPLVWKLKDSHENVQKLVEFFNRSDTLAKADLEAFIKGLIELFEARKITVEGKTYAYTSTLFNEALFTFIEKHLADFANNTLSAKIANHIALITVTAAQIRSLQAVGDMYVVTVPGTNYTFRLHQNHLPLVMHLFEQISKDT